MQLCLEEQYDKIYKYCYFKVSHAQLAEDLTQETFLKFFAQTSYQDMGKSLNCLYTIARNLCVDAYRKKELLPLEEAMESEHTMEGLEARVVLREAVTALPQEEQEIVVLHFIDELRINEIAGVMGVSRFFVYRKLKSALASLKAVLREEDFA